MAEQIGCLGAILEFFGFKVSLNVDEYPYRRKSLLTKAETSFYHVLRQTVGDEYKIVCMVRLADIFEVQVEEGWRGHFNRISAKHIDFVLCDPQTMETVIAIELDDKSHQRKSRIERDRFIDDLFRRCEFPLLRVKCRATYSIKALRDLIQEAIPATEP